MDEANAFGGDMALNIYNVCDGCPSSDTIDEVRATILGAFAAKLRYQGAPEGVVEPACREVVRAFEDFLQTLLAEATPRVAH